VKKFNESRERESGWNLKDQSNREPGMYDTKTGQNIGENLKGVPFCQVRVRG
jgi:hypothetical protein